MHRFRAPLNGGLRPSPTGSIRDVGARPWSDRWERYVLAIALVVVTIVVKTVLFGADHPFLMLPVAVALAAWAGGRGPGLLAAVLVSLASLYQLLQPAEAPVETGDVLTIVALVVESIFVALLTAGLRSALRRAHAAWAESAAAHREAAFALAIRDELLLLWTQQLRGPMADLEAQARAALLDLEREGYAGAATEKLTTLVHNAALVGRTTAGWDKDGHPSGSGPSPKSPS